MKRPVRNALALMLLVAAGCSNPPSASSVDLAGPDAVAIAGRYVLVASTTESQLRVFGLEGDRGFIRAPNPLYPLAIPTDPFPRALAAFTGGVAAEETAPFAFAVSTARASISVVSTQDLELLGRFEIPDVIPLSATVAAPAAGRNTELVLGVSRDGAGELYRVEVPQALLAAPEGIPDLAKKVQGPDPVDRVGLGVGSNPQSLAANPKDFKQVAVADRGPDAGLAIVDLDAKTVERFDVGGPVRAVEYSPDGTKIFGILDSEACPPEAPCSGAFAVDLASRVVTAPIAVPGTPRGISVGGSVNIVVAGQTEPVVANPLVLVSSTDGSIYLINGAGGGVIDAEAGGAKVAEASFLNASGVAEENANGPVAATVVVKDGVAVTETITLEYEGLLPAATALPGTLVAAQNQIDVPGVDLSAVVQANDVVEISGCAASSTVAAATSGAVTLTAPTTCAAGAVSFSVRAAGKYVVTGSVSGFLGRVGANEPFTSAPLDFTMGPGSPVPGVKYVLSVSSGLVPYAIPLGFLSMPGAIDYDPKLQYFYATYQGGNALVEVRPGELRPGQDSGVSVYR